MRQKQLDRVFGYRLRNPQSPFTWFRTGRIWEHLASTLFSPSKKKTNWGILQGRANASALQAAWPRKSANVKCLIYIHKHNVSSNYNEHKIRLVLTSVWPILDFCPRIELAFTQYRGGPTLFFGYRPLSFGLIIKKGWEHIEVQSEEEHMVKTDILEVRLSMSTSGNWTRACRETFYPHLEKSPAVTRPVVY